VRADSAGSASVKQLVNETNPGGPDRAAGRVPAVESEAPLMTGEMTAKKRSRVRPRASVALASHRRSSPRSATNRQPTRWSFTYRMMPYCSGVPASSGRGFMVDERDDATFAPLENR
jgi:hypothetical protein